jgi:hypothetical protein
MDKHLFESLDVDQTFRISVKVKFLVIVSKYLELSIPEIHFYQLLKAKFPLKLLVAQ